MYAADFVTIRTVSRSIQKKIQRDVEALMSDDFKSSEMTSHFELLFKNIIDDMDISKKVTHSQTFRTIEIEFKIQ